MKILYIGVYAFLIFLVAGCGESQSNNPTNPVIRTYTAAFTESSIENLKNPDRGFIKSSFHLEIKSGYDRFKDAYTKGYRLVYAPLVLSDYVDTKNLPSSLLNTLRDNMEDIKKSGLKIIFRIVYRENSGGEDPQKGIILAHLNQLKSILQKYRDDIYVVQIGMIGPWGEWHNFTGDFSKEETVNYKQNRIDIVKALANIFPNKFLEIRTPMHKELLFGASKFYGDKSNRAEITQDIAYTNDIWAKIGYHDDCVLSNNTDRGTFTNNNIEFWKNYVANDTIYTPIGGESCGIASSTDEKLSECSNAVNYLKKLHFSYLNDYEGDIIKKWKREGCYKRIKTDLGYRLVAQNITLLQREKSLDISLEVANKGYASPYYKYETEFILKNDNNQTFYFNSNIDFRKLYQRKSRGYSFSIPTKNIPSGIYSLLFRVGDLSYPIHFSNKDIWNSKEKANILLEGIVIN